jgi:uncharacterized SAM-binding protein YcdF (DUF218 family)
MQFVEFLFSTGGVICTIVGALLWIRLRERSKAAPRFLVILIVAYAAAGAYPISHNAGRLLMLHFRPFSASDAPSGRTAVVVLGTGSFTARDWEGNNASIPDRSGAARIIEAARVYRLIGPEWVISSGGHVYADDTNAPSGATMRDMLVSLGVPASRILVETDSKNTHDEAVIIRSMLKSVSVEHVVLVTADLHMRRSLGAFRAQGIHAIPAIARRPTSRPPWNFPWLPSDAGLAETGAVAREVLGIGYYALRGWYRFA